MLIFSYRKLCFLLLSLLFALGAAAQQDHFVYLQTDNGKPFYVKLDNKILSSSSEGYIILPKMTSGTYKVKVGFPKKDYSEASFTINVAAKNQGFLIKHFEDKGLELFNMETLALIDGDPEPTTNTVVTTTTDNDPFTKMLANVVKDSSILQNHQVTESPVFSNDTTKSVKEETASAFPAVADTSASANVNSPATSVSPENNSDNSEAPTSPDLSSHNAKEKTISKVMSMKNDYGLQMLYADASGNSTDTIEVFMSTPKKANPDSAFTAIDSNRTNSKDFDFTGDKTSSPAAVDTSQLTITPTPIDSGNKKSGFFLRTDSISDSTHSGDAKTAPEQVFYIGPNEKKETPSNTEDNSSEEKKGLFSGLTKSSKKESTEAAKPAENTIEVLPSEAKASNSNSDCKAFADNGDFLRLRKKMASENNKEAMIKVAGKFFRSRCFSTSQIKNLSYLFLTDEGKYMFFDAAYAHTSDSDQYATLASQLKDPYYRSRFEAMIKK